MSSTIEVVRFQPGHALLLDVTNSDAAWLANPVEQFTRQAREGSAYTLLIDKRVAGVGGVVEIWRGLGEAWFVASPLARTKPVAMTKAAIRVVAYSLQSSPLRRLQAHVKTSDKRAIRWAESMGFVREATLRRYGVDGSDYDLMAIVR